MYWLVVLMSLAIFSLVASGLYLEFRPARIASGPAPAWFKPMLGTQLLSFFGALIGILVLGVGDAMAEAGAVATQAAEISTGMGLAILGVGIPTALSTIGAGIAVGPIGAASLAAVVERPEALGRSLIFLGLAEGIAIYGLVMSILLLNRI
jgi:V/A-type H+-transporting ATPase subunit K